MDSTPALADCQSLHAPLVTLDAGPQGQTAACVRFVRVAILHRPSQRQDNNAHGSCGGRTKSTAGIFVPHTWSKSVQTKGQDGRAPPSFFLQTLRRPPQNRVVGKSTSFGARQARCTNVIVLLTDSANWIFDFGILEAVVRDFPMGRKVRVLERLLGRESFLWIIFEQLFEQCESVQARRFWP